MGECLLALAALSAAAVLIAVYEGEKADRALTDEQRAKKISDRLIVRLQHSSRAAVLAG